MKYKFLIFLSFLFTFFSCSKSDESSTPTKTNLPEVNVIVFNIDIICTDDFGIETNSLLSNFYNSQVSFYRDSPLNNFIIQKNVITNNLYTITNLCKEPDEDIRYITSNYNKILVFTIGNELINGVYESYLWILDRDSESCQRIFIGNNYQLGLNIGTNNIYIEDNNVLIGFYDEVLDKNKIINIDLNSAQVIASIEFESTPFASTIIDSKLIVLFYQQENKVYNKNTLEPIEDTSFKNIPISVNPSFFKSELYNNKLFLDVELAQPNITSFAPGYIDLTTNELYMLNSFDIMAKYGDIYGYGFNSYDHYTTYPNKNIVVTGFTNNLGEYGLIYTNYEGDILKIITLEHKVRYVLKR